MHWHSLREHQVNLKKESKENSTSDPLRPSVNYHLILSAGGFVFPGILWAPLQQAPGSVLCRETPGVTLAKRPPSWPQQSIDSQALEGDSGGLGVEKKSGLTGKDPDAGKDWGRRRREWQRTRCLDYIRLNEHEFEQAPGDGEGQGSLAGCSPWGHRVGHSWATGQQPLEKCSCGRRPVPSGDPISSPSHFRHPWSQLLAAAASVRRKPRLSLSWIDKWFERDVKGKMSKRKCEEKGNGGESQKEPSCQFVVVYSLSPVWLSATSWIVTHHTPLSMGFSRQEYWGGLPFPPPGNLSGPGMEPRSPMLQADSLPPEPPGKHSCQLLLVKRRLARASASVLIKPELTVMTGKSPLVTDLARSSFCKRLV